MFVRKEVSKEEITLVVRGTLSAETAEELHRHLDELAGGRWRTVSLDLSATDAINSSSLGKLLLFRKRLAEDGRVLRINGCSEQLYRTFQMIQFDKLIPIKR